MFYYTYVLLIVFIAAVAIGGYESTLRLVRYIELSIRYEIVKVQMWFIKRKLEKELGIPPRDWSDFNGRN